MCTGTPVWTKPPRCTWNHRRPVCLCMPGTPPCPATRTCLQGTPRTCRQLTLLGRSSPEARPACTRRGTSRSSNPTRCTSRATSACSCNRCNESPHEPTCRPGTTRRRCPPSRGRTASTMSRFLARRATTSSPPEARTSRKTAATSRRRQMPATSRCRPPSSAPSTRRQRNHLRQRPQRCSCRCHTPLCRLLRLRPICAPSSTPRGT
mmetsp:Transcript_125472/g.362995  ORF Transcript_125472/g.362995 Transcript_125472/m.362995 type:complete len:207 (-) Transcript_125472:1533-2153(-)